MAIIESEVADTNMANVLPESMPQWSHIKEDVLWKKYNHRGTRLIGSEKEIS